MTYSHTKIGYLIQQPIAKNYDTDLSYNTFNFDAMLRDYPESGLNLHSTLHVTSYSQVDDTEEVNQNGVPPLTKPLKGR